MNILLLLRTLGSILLVEGAAMTPSLLISLIYGEGDAIAFVWTLLILTAIGLPLRLLCKPEQTNLRAKEGFLAVALAWVLLSVFGALPFVFSGMIPNFVDALFESVSGFTTTGASIMTMIEGQPHGVMFWRSFTHWIGGMGVLVFLLAILPGGGGSGFTMHLLRAESPGPDVGKLVPKMRQTASILYVIYIALTILNVIFLLFGKMHWLNALCTAFGTAGTGGFGVFNDSLGSVSPYIQNVTTVFMFLFGVNFSCYYLLLLGKLRSVFKDEELRLYVGLAVASILAIVLNIRPLYATLEETVRHAAFQVSSIMTTTGYTTTDYDLWPAFSKAILLMLMMVGACAGSTGGGLKCIRVLLLFKALRRNIRQILNPRKVLVVRSNDKVVDEKVLANTNAYFAAYVIILVVCTLILSLDGFNLETNLSATIATFNNIGPGMAAVGPTCNYAAYSALSKLTMSLAMLAGRLEIFPILILFSRGTWRRK